LTTGFGRIPAALRARLRSLRCLRFSFGFGLDIGEQPDFDVTDVQRDFQRSERCVKLSDPNAEPFPSPIA
jgi:hypothetical protein